MQLITISQSSKIKKPRNCSIFFQILTNSSPLYLPAWLLCHVEELAYGGVNPFWVLLSGLSLCCQPVCPTPSWRLMVMWALASRGAGGLCARSQSAWHEAEIKREIKQKVGREKGEEKARVDGGGVLIDGSLIWGASIDRLLPLPSPHWCSRTSWARECAHG